MIFSNKRRAALMGVGAIAAAAVTVSNVRNARSSDHADTTQAVAKPGIDLTDLHIFPSPTTPSNVVLSMSVRPLIPAGQAAGVTTFDTDVLYQFKIDTNATDANKVENLVIQARFEGTGLNQKVFISGPIKPSGTTTTSVFEKAGAATQTGVFNTPFTANGMKVFAGLRQDPFFVDLVQLGNILPDRVATLPSVFPGKRQPLGQENNVGTTSWRPDPANPQFGGPDDFLKNFNLLGFVVEIPRSRLGGRKIGVWMTTSVANR